MQVSSLRLAAENLVAPESAPSLCVLKWGGLGSVLTTRPFLRALRERFGRSRQIIFITSAANAPLVKRMGLVDEICLLDPRRFPATATIALARRLRRKAPAAFFDLQIHTHRRLAAMISCLSGAPRRFAFFRPRERPSPACHAIFANPFAPVDELYLEMARQAGAAPTPGEAWRRLAISQKDHDRAAALLHGWLGARDHLLIVNPNASATAYVRRWPLAHYAKAIGILLRDLPGLKIALIGAAEEAAYVADLHRLLPSGEARVKNFAGLTSLGGLMALLSRADCLLSNDSGPLHLALALETPVVGLFGPVHPGHNARLGRPERKIILYQPMLCSPCVHYAANPPCGGDNLCMQSIEPENAAAACRALLSKNPLAATRIPQKFSSLDRHAHDNALMSF